MKDLDKRTDALLKQGLVNTPDDFRDSVMQKIATYERQSSSVTDNDVVLPRVPWWQWVVITLGSLIGGGQVLRFIFSLWFVSSAAY